MTTNLPKYTAAWRKHVGRAGDGQPISYPRIVWVALLAGIIVFLVLYAGGYAFGEYNLLRFRDKNVALDGTWTERLCRFARNGAVVAAALVAGWRLMNREEARWSSAAFVLVVALFTILVWPTPWTYRQFGCQVYQVNRFVGTWTHITTLPACEAETRVLIHKP